MQRDNAIRGNSKLIENLPMRRDKAYPNGAWHQTNPSRTIYSAVPLIKPPPTHVAAIEESF